MMNARNLYSQSGYSDWRKFDKLIFRAKHLIKNGLEKGVIQDTTTLANLGMGGVRIIKDYLLDEDAVTLIRKMSLSYKLGKSHSIRNETSILSLLQKYCIYKNLPYHFQFRLMGFIYDFCCSNILIEFDEPHHVESDRQINKDLQKDQVAITNGYKIFRFNLNHDIIDMIQCIDTNCNK